MCPLPSQPRYNGYSGLEGQDRDARATAGWEASFEVYRNDKRTALQVINLANKKVSLSHVFSKYNITLDEIYSSTGWDFRGCCPFPDHYDKTPSFGYNPRLNIFNCFGCHRSGKSVEFISFLEKRSKLSVAHEILKKYASEDEIVFEVAGFDYEKLEKLLFEYADCIREFKTKNNSEKGSKYAKAVTWNLDVYLRKYGPSHSIDLDDLEARLIMLKRQLEAFEEKE